MDPNTRAYTEQKLLLYSKVHSIEMRVVIPPPQKKQILIGTKLTLTKA